jgi:hypothetical protein
VTTGDDNSYSTISEAGRACPLHYRYRPSELAATTPIEAQTLYVVDGLYGNLEALDVIESLAAEDVDEQGNSARIAFNGDFNWFNAEHDWFVGLNERVLKHTALRGNVETELGADSGDNGCGCAYPEWVDDDVVSRSNSIMDVLRHTARREPALTERLTRLPMIAVAQIGAARVGIVHGDLNSLAGWDLSPERLARDGAVGRLTKDMTSAEVDIVSSSHTCISLFRRWQSDDHLKALVAGLRANHVQAKQRLAKPHLTREMKDPPPVSST